MKSKLTKFLLISIFSGFSFAEGEILDTTKLYFVRSTLTTAPPSSTSNDNTDQNQHLESELTPLKLNFIVFKIDLDQREILLVNKIQHAVLQENLKNEMNDANKTNIRRRIESPDGGISGNIMIENDKGELEDLVRVSNLGNLLVKLEPITLSDEMQSDVRSLLIRFLTTSNVEVKSKLHN